MSHNLASSAQSCKIENSSTTLIPNADGAALDTCDDLKVKASGRGCLDGTEKTSLKVSRDDA